MNPLPAALERLLERAPRIVVAPVALGFAQDALASWARAGGRAVLHDPAPNEGDVLYLPRSRRDAADLPAAWPLRDALFLTEADVVMTPEEWRAALQDVPPAQADAAYRATGGWPEALELVRRTRSSALPLHRHPLVIAHLTRLLPDGPLRAPLERAARAPLVIPELLDELALEPAELRALLDAGLLYPHGVGFALPPLVRAFLHDVPDATTTKRVARLLAERGHLGAALEAYAGSGLWPEYLAALTERFESSRGETTLRGYLQDLPIEARDTPHYRYLVALLERLHGDLERALEGYAAARRGAPKDLRARIDNARGVALALRGRDDEALRAFGSASRTAEGLLRGEALHNRGGMLLRLRRHDDAERDLQAAARIFRQSGSYVREARSLHTLALSNHQRGLLRSAERRYREALELLASLGQPTALLRVNLAEALLLLGRYDEALEALEAAEAERGGGVRRRVHGYALLNRALHALMTGRPDDAETPLAEVLALPELEEAQRAEAHLLVARMHRQRGDARAAREALERAGGAGLAADVERVALGADPEPALERARAEDARFELAVLLLLRGTDDDVREALTLVRDGSYGSLLTSPEHAPALARLAQDDPSLRASFPMRMRTFGAFSVTFLGRTFTLASFPTRKSAALLVRLALGDFPLSRDAAAEAFWGDARDPGHSLQTALYHLNRTFGVPIVDGRKGRLELRFDTQLDLRELERASADAARLPPSERAAALRRALGGVDGPLLAEFDDWFDDERRHGDALRVRALRQLADLETDDPWRSIAALQGLLELEPYDLEARESLARRLESVGEDERARGERARARELAAELS